MNRKKNEEQNKDWWTIDEWIAEFGAQYGYINKYSRRHVQRCCAGEVIKKKRSEYTCRLPEGWEAEKLAGSGRGVWIIKREKSK